MKIRKKKIIVVGAGAAGMMAAIRAAECGQDVVLLEKNTSAGKKLLLTGKGRCNVTNACALDDFLARFIKNGAFLRDSFKRFFNTELIAFFETRKLPLKTERQQRVFPVTDSSRSILNVLIRELKTQRVTVCYNAECKHVLIRNDVVCGVKLRDNTEISGDRVIFATGGASYAFTGSTGGGITIAQGLGHRIEPLRAALVPLVTAQKYPRQLEGLSLKNITLTFMQGKKRVMSPVGEMIFTSFGVSGPLVLSLSAMVVDWLRAGKKVSIAIDLKPGLSREQLEQRLARDIREHPKQAVKTFLRGYMPQRLCAVFLACAEIKPGQKTHALSPAERARIITLLKAWTLDVKKALPLKEAMVTQGGVSLKDIDPRTMASRKIKGLFFAGEMIDIAADTGGFNLQAAFSTGFCAGESAAN